ncbi:hypothetical protein ON010_g11858 [Phytophthora cinnamomi]|nr:hypothetical protein ON010_g11858 [Phytophthora cinnamomi]
MFSRQSGLATAVFTAEFPEGVDPKHDDQRGAHEPQEDEGERAARGARVARAELQRAEDGADPAPGAGAGRGGVRQRGAGDGGAQGAEPQEGQVSSSFVLS